jgi:hypothetical protein
MEYWSLISRWILRLLAKAYVNGKLTNILCSLALRTSMME